MTKICHPCNQRNPRRKHTHTHTRFLLLHTNISMWVGLPNSRRRPASHQNMSDVITLGEPARLWWRGCGCLRRDGGGGSRLVKRGSDLKCSKRSKLTQTSPQTSCLRLSLRQGNLAGAKGPRSCGYVCVCVDVCWVSLLGLEPGRGGRGRVCRSPRALGQWDGLWWTRRDKEDFPCLSERADQPRRTHTEGEACLRNGFYARVCVCVCGMKGVGQASGWFCV